MKVNTFPKLCNVCGGKVEFVPLTSVYGKNFKSDRGERFCSGYCYRCKDCGALVGTHKSNPREALGLLATPHMRELRVRNHAMFDKFWKDRSQRTKYYKKLANEMGIPFEECHFAWFTEEELEKSYQIMLRWWREKYDI